MAPQQVNSIWRVACVTLLCAAAGVAPATVHASQAGLAASRPAQQRPAPAKPASSSKTRTSESVPPLSYVCPMAQDAEVVDSEAGACRKCGMALVPTRLETAWSCPVHPDVLEGAPGRCPIDKRNLVQITASEYWYCPTEPNDHLLDPGACADGSRRLRKFERRPHGDHNPRHGGQFFMADDNWHHLEGTYRANGVFRVYFYNDFTQPIPARGFTGSLVVLDARDQPVGQPVALVRSGVSNALDARLSGARLPLAVKLRVKFAPSDKDRVFDFAFAAVSKAPVARATGVPAFMPPSANTPTPPPVAPPPLPATVSELVGVVVRARDDVGTALARGALTDVWYPAFTAKDAALALQNHETELPLGSRGAAASAVNRVVLSAWQLDAAGDLGDKAKLTEAFRVFSAAVDEIRALHAAPR